MKFIIYLATHFEIDTDIDRLTKIYNKISVPDVWLALKNQVKERDKEMLFSNQ